MSERFKLLQEHWNRLSSTPIHALFDQDPERFSKFSIQFEDLIFDYSKQHIDAETLALLNALVDEADLEAKRDAMFNGDKVNTTEGRAVLHTALRATRDTVISFDGEDVVPQVHATLDRALSFAEAIRAGEFEVSGGRITDVVNIGIGGSDLGPKMAVRALAPYANGPTCHFVSNVDSADISDTLSGFDLSTTLFIIASKSFTTQETMLNARSAMQMMKVVVGKEKAADHFCAVSTNLEATRAFGIPDEHTFGFWDWVGGRFSVWSAIGLPLMIAIGPDAFHAFQAGARSCDEHFKSQPFETNIPVLMALLGVWNRNCADLSAHAILPYDDRMSDFPRWLQQLDMESNGKCIKLDGHKAEQKTAPIIFGEPGTNGQHAFYQMLHQGCDIIPCDFLVAAKSHEPDLANHHSILLANCFAQSEALMCGRTLAEVDGNTHRVFEGNRPSTTFLYRQLDPYTLGKLMALYEHKIFVQGVIWGTNPFDQWGVELGKELARTIEPALITEAPDQLKNASTRGLVSATIAFNKS